mgnify:CR=1 FL=1
MFNILSERIIAKTKDKTSIKSNVPKSIINCKNSKNKSTNKVKIDISTVLPTTFPDQGIDMIYEQ